MTKSIQTVGVCGAGGTMGAGIALVAARAGFRTISFDASAAALDRAACESAAHAALAAVDPAGARAAVRAALGL